MFTFITFDIYLKRKIIIESKKLEDFTITKVFVTGAIGLIGTKLTQRLDYYKKAMRSLALQLRNKVKRNL